MTCPHCGKTEKGHKCDRGKPRLDLIPPDAWLLLARVLEVGATKYAPYNWAEGMEWSRCYAACLRHLTAWWSGETDDPETGISHIGHALCCLAFLATYEARSIGTDDRYKWPSS